MQYRGIWIFLFILLLFLPQPMVKAEEFNTILYMKQISNSQHVFAKVAYTKNDDTEQENYILNLEKQRLEQYSDHYEIQSGSSWELFVNDLNNFEYNITTISNKTRVSIINQNNTIDVLYENEGPAYNNIHSVTLYEFENTLYVFFAHVVNETYISNLYVYSTQSYELLNKIPLLNTSLDLNFRLIDSPNLREDHKPIAFLSVGIYNYWEASNDRKIGYRNWYMINDTSIEKLITIPFSNGGLLIKPFGELIFAKISTITIYDMHTFEKSSFIIDLTPFNSTFIFPELLYVGVVVIIVSYYLRKRFKSKTN